jgi:rubrerythrin
MSTVQGIFRKFYDRYLEQYKSSAAQAKVALAIRRCKTAALGGHVCGCEECGHLSVHYNSCRDRHCPMCQGVNKMIWVDQRRRDI